MREGVLKCDGLQCSDGHVLFVYWVERGDRVVEGEQFGWERA